MLFLYSILAYIAVAFIIYRALLKQTVRHDGYLEADDYKSARGLASFWFLLLMAYILIKIVDIVYYLVEKVR